MSKKDPRVLLAHILDSIEKIEAVTLNLSESDFLSSSLFQDAVERRLEIIGEASVYIGDEYKKAHAEIEWAEIVGTRNKIIHEYLTVDHALVWKIVKQDLPRLKRQITNLLNKDN
jgi:uncharacterized protein with HEPN domain